MLAAVVSDGHARGHAAVADLAGHAERRARKRTEIPQRETVMWLRMMRMQNSEERRHQDERTEQCQSGFHGFSFRVEQTSAERQQGAPLALTRSLDRRFE